MLARFDELLAQHRRVRTAIGAFTCYDLETAFGVLGAAADRGSSVLLLVSSAAFAQPGGDQLLAALRATVELSNARACLQLDHASDLDLIGAAFEAGCGAVMADGSKLAVEDNTSLVADAVQIACRFDGAVEAELGHVSGDEDIAHAESAGKLTNPEDVRRFISRTRASCLAVSIGNVHGTYPMTPHLDWARLAAIRRSSDVPLSLHGASGLPGEDVRRAIAEGIVKINVNTELRERYLDATANALPGARDGSNMLALHRSQTSAAYAVTVNKLNEYEDNKLNEHEEEKR